MLRPIQDPIKIPLSLPSISSTPENTFALGGNAYSGGGSAYAGFRNGAATAWLQGLVLILVPATRTSPRCGRGGWVDIIVEP